jgi:hypothetical protein
MNIVERAKAITLNPAATWPTIEAEEHTVQSLFVPYLLILAAIPAVASFIGMSIVGMGAFGFSMRIPIVSGIAMMITSYVLSLAATLGMAWVVSALAPTFGGQNNFMQGLKIMVFGSTPMMLAGVLSILPALGMLSLLAAFYCLYLLYLGLPVLMKNPKEKTIPYMIVLAICGLVAGVVMGALSALFMPSPTGFKMGSGAGMPADMTISTPQGNATISVNPGAAGATASGNPNNNPKTDDASLSIKTPEGEVKIDMKNMEAFAKQMEEMAKKMEQANKK